MLLPRFDLDAWADAVRPTTVRSAVSLVPATHCARCCNSDLGPVDLTGIRAVTARHRTAVRRRCRRRVHRRSSAFRASPRMRPPNSVAASLSWTPGRSPQVPDEFRQRGSDGPGQPGRPSCGWRPGGRDGSWVPIEAAACWRSSRASWGPDAPELGAQLPPTRPASTPTGSCGSRAAPPPGDHPRRLRRSCPTTCAPPSESPPLPMAGACAVPSRTSRLGEVPDGDGRIHVSRVTRRRTRGWCLAESAGAMQRLGCEMRGGGYHPRTPSGKAPT